MNKKTLISVVVIAIMLLNCFAPLARVYAEENTSNTITLNSELYTAVSDYMKNNNVKGFTYNDLLRTITATSSSFSSVKELILKEKGIDDLSGLEVFTGLTKLDLSGNYLTLDSNLEVINGFSSLKSLDLSTNRIDGFGWLTLNNLEYRNLNRQDIKIVRLIDIPAKPANNDFSELPEQFDEITGMLSELDLESIDVDIHTYRTDGKRWELNPNRTELTSNMMIAYEDIDEVGLDVIDYDETQFKFNWADIYATKADKKMYYINTRVVNSEHMYYDSNVDLYYIFVDENSERGIIFKDENFYKCVKAQLTKGQTINKNLLSYGDQGSSSISSAREEFSMNQMDILDFQGSYDTIPHLLRARENYVPDGESCFATDSIISELEEMYTNNELITPTEEGEYTYETQHYSISLTISVPEGYTGRGAQFALEIIRHSDPDVSGSRDLYNAAYDKALTLVISKNDLRNNIVSLFCQNEKIRDLTGLERFIGLETELDVSFNYINSIERIIELENNKSAEENTINGEIKSLISQITSSQAGLTGEETVNYRDMLKKYLDKVEEYNKKLAAYEAATQHSQAETDALQKLQEECTKAENDAKKAMKNLIRILNKLRDVYYKAYKLSTIQTPALFDLLDESSEEEPYKKSISDLSKDEAFGILTAQLQKIESLEKDKNLSEDQTRAIVESLANIFGINFTPSTESDGGSNQGGPMSQFIKFCGTQIKNDGTKAQYQNALSYIKLADSSITTLGTFSQFDNIPEEEFGSYIRLMYQITGRIIINGTDDMLNVLLKMPRLKDLNISRNNIESLQTIDQLTKLLRLNASHNLLTTIEDVNWSQIEYLVSLNLGYNQLQTYEALRGNPSKLKDLYLNNCLFSGVFDFDFLNYFDNLKYITFAGNYYSDLSLLVNKYQGKLKKTNYESLVSYIKGERGVTFDFRNQTVKIDAGQIEVASNGIVTIQLPPIFKNVNDMDPHRTTYGVVPETGTVDEYGKNVIFTNYTLGRNTGKVTIETVLTNINNNENNKASVGSGTICYIEYELTNVPERPPVTPVANNTTENTNTDANNNTNNNTNDNNNTNNQNNNNNTNEATNVVTANDIAVYENRNDTYLLVAQPKSTNASLASTLNSLGMNVKSINGKSDFTNDTKSVYTSEVVVATENGEDKAYEVVVLGDVDGDGDIDSIDSGYSRALKYGTLYADVSEVGERTRLMSAFKNTSNFRAADLNQDGSVKTNETAQLLYYRAGLLKNFDAILSNIAE